MIAFGFSLQAQLPVLLDLYRSNDNSVICALAREQLAQRQLMPILQWVIIVVTIAVWAVPELHNIFTLILMLWGLLICLIYAILLAGL